MKKVRVKSKTNKLLKITPSVSETNKNNKQKRTMTNSVCFRIAWACMTQSSKKI